LFSEKKLKNSQTYNRLLHQFQNLKKSFLLCTNFCVIIAVSDCSNWRLPYYASFAIISVWLAVSSIIMWTPVFVKRSNKKLFIDIGGTLFLLVILFAGLTYRYVLSVGILSTTLMRSAKSKSVPTLMISTTMALSVFPLLPVVEPYPRVYIV